MSRLFCLPALVSAARLAARLAEANKVMEESSTAGASADGDAVERQPDSDDDEWM